MSRLDIFNACKEFNQRTLGPTPINLRGDYAGEFRGYTGYTENIITQEKLDSLIKSYNDNHNKILKILS